MGLISRVSSRTYRIKINMEQEAHRSNQDEPANGPLTQTTTATSTSPPENSIRIELNIRPENVEATANTTPGRGVRWTEDTVDNEHMNKKSSKKCCIFHKPKIHKEDQSSSSSSSSEDSDTNAYEKLPKKQRRKLRKDHEKKGRSSCDGHDH